MHRFTPGRLFAVVVLAACHGDPPPPSGAKPVELAGGGPTAVAPAGPAPSAPPERAPALGDGGAPPDAALPDRVGTFAGQPLVRGQGFIRRDYEKGQHDVEVTIGKYPMSAAAYAGWLQQRKSYPAAVLDVPDDAGSGFYTCAGQGGDERCDLHVQLRNGHHLELVGSRSATRAEVDEVAHGLPLRALSASAAP